MKLVVVFASRFFFKITISTSVLFCSFLSAQPPQSGGQGTVRYTVIVRYGGDNGSRSYPMLSGQPPSQGGQNHYYSSGNYSMPSGIFTGISGSPDLDKAYQAAVFSSLNSGQSPETKAKFDYLSELIQKYGSEGASAKISEAFKADLKNQYDRLSKISAFDPGKLPEIPGSARLPLSALPADLAAPLKTAVRENNPFKTLEAVDEVMKEARTADRDERKQWERALKGTLLDANGLLNVGPDAPHLVSLTTAWASVDGRQIRHSFNELLIAQQIFEGEHRLYCQKSGEKACQEQTAQMQAMRVRFLDISVSHAIADRMSLHKVPGFDLLMKELQNVTSYYYLTAKNLFEATVKTGEGYAQILLHPVDSLGKMTNLGVALCESILHFDQTLNVISKALVDNSRKFLYGTQEESSKVLAEAVVQIGTMYLVPAAAKFGDALLKGAVARATTYIALEGVSRAAVASGKFNEAARKGLLNLARVFPDTGKTILTMAEESLPKLGALEHKAASSKTVIAAVGYADPAVAALAREAPEKVINSIEKIGYSKTAIDAVIAAGENTRFDSSLSNAVKTYRDIGGAAHLTLKRLAEESPNSAHKLLESTGHFLGSSTEIRGSDFARKYPKAIERFVEEGGKTLQAIENGKPIEVYFGINKKYAADLEKNGFFSSSYIESAEQGKQSLSRFGAGRYMSTELETARTEILQRIANPEDYVFYKTTFNPGNGLQSNFIIFPSVRNGSEGGINIVVREIAEKANTYFGNMERLK